MLYNTLNVFYVSDDGTLIQKAFAPGLGGADANGWVTSRLTAVGRCKAGGDVDAQDGYQNNFHLFARAADGDHMLRSPGGPMTTVSWPWSRAAVRNGTSGCQWLAPPSEHAASTRT